MIKIFGYELKRILVSWLFLAMLIVNGVFGWYILTTDIVAGIAYTAPFSVWSFCAYLGKTLPIAVITVLLILSNYYGKKQKQVEILTLATPITPAQLLIIRSAVLGVCLVIICAVTVMLSAVFYINFFNYNRFGAYILPAFLIIVPCFVFSISLGHLLGRVHQCLIYLLLLITFIVGFCGITNAFDFFGAGYFSAYPMTLPVNSEGEPDFIMNDMWLAARGVYFLVGVAFLAWSIKIKYKATKA